MKKRKLLGSWLNSASPIIAEVMSKQGFDFLAIDIEHSAVDVPQALGIFHAIKAGNHDCLPFVRTQGVEYSFVKRYLDAGAKGIIAPLVNTKEQAEELIRGTKYPPLGGRGVGYCPANAYGQDLVEEFSAANDEIYTIVQIEDIQAVRNIESILSVNGIDGVFIGPFDLSASMGITGQFNHQDFLKAKEEIARACKEADIPVGIHVVEPDPDALEDAICQGYEIIAYGLDISLVRHACKGGVERWGELLKG